jgi:hypothetical protein
VSEFTDLIDWTERLCGIQYRTTSPLRWEVAVKGSGAWITVPVGFVFDVSVPHPVRWLISPHDPRYLPAACLHDWLLAQGWDRVRAAAEFALALEAKGVPPARRLVMFLCVAVYKWFAVPRAFAMPS